jgi:DNA-binding transcriptional ArsR family regulator
MRGSRPLDGFFDVLANEHRRRILVALLEQNSLVGPGFDLLPGEYSRGEMPDSLEIQLYHYHLPYLEEAGLVTWDRDTLAVRKGPRFGEIRPLLVLLQSNAEDLPLDWP